MQWALPNVDVYHTERWGKNEGFKYQLSIPKDGTYTLILKFSEIYFQEPGQKVFDVKLGNKAIATDIDILAALGSRGLPYDIFVDLKVEGGKVYANGVECSGAFKNNKLQIDFAVGRADNPKVNAILLVQGGKENTHYNSYRRYLKALEDLKDQQRKQ